MKENSKAIKWIFWKDCLVDWGIIIVCFYLIAFSGLLWLQICSAILIGIEQYRLMVLLHDCMHQTIFKTRKKNFLIGNLIIGWWVGIDINGFNRFHSAHHAYNGSDKDPELIDGKGNPMMRYVGRWDLPLTPYKLFFWFVFEVIMGPFYALLLSLGLKVKKNKNGTVNFQWEEFLGSLFVIGGAGYVLYMLNALWVMGVWFAALSLVFNALFNLRILTEHLGCAIGETIILAEPKKWYEWLYAITAGAHHIGYHHEHHGNNKIPYMLLPEKRKKNLKENLKTMRLIEVLSLHFSSPPIKSGEVMKEGDSRSLIYRGYP